MSSGRFTERDRAAIYSRDDQRCVGCSAGSPLTIQHRRARGMGGTHRTMTAADGVTLDGSGTTGCHGWAEHNPAEAELLGWRSTGDPAVEPWWDSVYGWRRASPEDPTLALYVDPSELDRLEERTAAVEAYRRALRA